MTPTLLQLRDLNAHHQRLAEGLAEAVSGAARALREALVAQGLADASHEVRHLADTSPSGVLRVVYAVPIEDAFYGAPGDVTLEIASCLRTPDEFFSWCGVRVLLAGRQLDAPLAGATLGMPVQSCDERELAPLRAALCQLDAPALAVRIHQLLVP